MWAAIDPQTSQSSLLNRDVPQTEMWLSRISLRMARDTQQIVAQEGEGMHGQCMAYWMKRSVQSGERQVSTALTPLH